MRALHIARQGGDVNPQLAPKVCRLACSDNGAHCIGFNANGEPVSTTSYLKGALRERPLIGKVDLSGVTLGVKNDS